MESSEKDIEAEEAFDDMFARFRAEAPIIRYDACGSPMPGQDLEGFFFPQYISPTIHDEMRTLEVRESDIWFCSYPRSGQHWMWNVAYRLTHDLNEAPKGYEEMCQAENVGHKLDDIPSRRIIRTHQMTKTVPQDVWDKKCKVINMVRHPKDVAVSFYKHLTATKVYGYQGTWEGYLPMFLNEEILWGGGWFKHIKDYKQKAETNDVLFITFEECKRDTLGTIKKLADYLGVQWSDENFQKMVDETSIKTMQKRNAEYEAIARKGRVDDIIYRKGDIGDWKLHFTTEQSETFNHVYKEKMDDFPFLYNDCLDV
ncbi:unnamed protein product [Owenia fusiformis]|uniref:Uncharacterized protein n=1 Tax=Owenia fusiformis TaxID=6347 RepID=A0A8J1XZ10_OWEFU|nr:unnamed protein product [Owenia fusiformis]